MQAIKTKSLESSSTSEAVFAALLGVVQNGKFAIFGLSNEQHRLLFTSGKTVVSWGQEYIASVEAADGRTTLHLVCGGVDGRPAALLDGWKNGKAADKVLTAVSAALTGTTSPTVRPTASFVTSSDGSTQPWTGTENPV